VTSWLYIAQSVPWIAAGLLVGFFMGRSTVAVEQIADAVQDEVDTMPEERKPRFGSIHALGAVVVLLGVFTAVQSYVQGEATAKLADCQQAYTSGFADAIDARSSAAAQAQDALDELLTKVASLTPTPEARGNFETALNDYLRKRAAAKKAQQEHPYPPAPRDVCKDGG